MQSPWLRPYVLTVAFLALTAQAPAPSASPESGDPLRHLEYAFKVHQEGDATTGTGGTGTMSVDILSVAADGALVVRISEWVKLELRPRQAYTCTVYGNTTVLCPSVPAPSQAEWVLLSYLGRQFVDGAPWDAQHHWKRTQHSAQFDEVEDFTMLPGSNDHRAMIRESKVVSIANGGYSKTHEDVTINYDRAMETPDIIHDDFTSVADDGQNTGHATYDFQLVKDSFAKS